MADKDIRQLQRLYSSGSIGQDQYLAALNRQETFESFLEYYRVLEATGQINSDDEREEILAAMARTFFADGWAFGLEELGINGGGDYYYDCPPIPQEARQYAEDYANKVEKQIGASLPVYYHALLRVGPTSLHSRVFDPEQFGFLLVMSGLGHGVGLWEHFEHRLVDVPLADTFSDFTLCAGCGDMLENTLEHNYYECQEEECYHVMCAACVENCNECGTLLCPECNPRCREHRIGWTPNWYNQSR